MIINVHLSFLNSTWIWFAIIAGIGKDILLRIVVVLNTGGDLFYGVFSVFEMVIF